MSNLLHFPHEAASTSPTQDARNPLLSVTSAVRRRASIAAGAFRRFLSRVRELARSEWTYEESRSPWRSCPTCPEIHNGGHRCPNRLVAFCLECNRRRLLDKFARCAAGHRSVVQITFRTSRS